MAEFKDIRIAGREECLTHDSKQHKDLTPVHPARKHCVHLKLSTQPPQVWQNMFLKIWRETQDVHWRDVEIEDDCIVIEISDADLQVHLLPVLEQAVEAANARYRE